MSRLALLLLLLLPAAAPARGLTVLFTNDVRGRLEPRRLMGGSRAGGAPVLAEIVAETRAGLAPDEDLLLVDSGDFLFGGELGARDRGAATVRLMNALGYGAAALGNHEFDLGAKTLAARAREARFPFLAANVHRRGLAAPAGVDPSRVLVLPRSGARVGVVGLTAARGVPTGPHSRNPGLRFAGARAALTRELDRLAGRRVDLVLALSHRGLEADRALAGAVPFVIGGHHPTRRVDEVTGGTRFLQAASDGLEVGRLRVRFGDGPPDPAAAAVDFVPWATRDAPAGPLDADLGALRAARPALGVVPARWTAAETAAWVLEAMTESARRAGVDPALALINRDALRAAMPRGRVDLATLRRIAPFENHLVHLLVPAPLLRRFLRRVGGRLDPRFLDPVLAAGTPRHALPRRGLVSVVTNDFLAAGGDGHAELAGVRRREVLRQTVLQAMRDDLRGRDLSEPPFVGEPDDPPDLGERAGAILRRVAAPAGP